MKKVLTLKGKIAAGVAAVTIVGSTSMAFASTNAGTQFGIWADAKIQAAQNAVVNALGTSKAGALNTLQNETNSKKNTAVSDVNTAAQTESTATQDAIQAKLNEHVASLETAYNTYSSTLGAKFDAFVTLQNNATKSSFTQTVSDLTTQLTNAISTAQNAGVSKITEESLLKKSQATADLIAKINQVKADLQAIITYEQNIAQGEVNAYLEAQVVAATGTLNSLVDTLKTAAINQINQTGEPIVTQAEADLQTIVNGIPNN